MLAETTAPDVAALARDAFARWASGVAVVTTADAEGRYRGFTASSFSSVSLAPPLVLVCLDRGAECLEAFARSDGFAVHVLRRDQRDLAARFARRGGDKFAGTRVSLSADGVPLLPLGLARLECRTERRVPAGDHVILIGEVRRAEAADGEPLLYYRRGYHHLPDGPGS